MNAAARTLTQGIAIASAPTYVRVLSLSRQTLLNLALLFAVVISALSVITLTDSNREMVGQLASLQQDSHQLNTQYSQLLLEENTWAAPSRVERVAKQTEDMVFPNPQKVVIIRP